MIEIAASNLPELRIAGYAVGWLGILLLIWSLLRQGAVSVIGLALLILAFIWLFILDYFVKSQIHPPT